MSDVVPWALADAPYRPQSLDAQPWRSAASETGDARYFVVAETLEAIDEEFRERGAIPNSAFERIWQRLSVDLAAIRESPDPRSATKLADRMRQEVLAMLDEPWPAPLR